MKWKSRLTSVEAYTDWWLPLPPLPHATFNATACVMNGRLYVMGVACSQLQVLEMSEKTNSPGASKQSCPPPGQEQ